MNLQEAAAYLGMTEAQIIRSRQRGLPPGKLAYTVDGKLYFDPSVLLPPPTPNSIAANPEKAAEMVQAVGRDLTDSHVSDDVAPRAEPAPDGEQEPYNHCIECDRAFFSAAGMASHMRAKHSEGESV